MTTVGERNVIAERWVEILNANPRESDVTNYFLQDVGADDSLIEQPVIELVASVLSSADLNDKDRAFLEAITAAVQKSPDGLAEQLGYSSDAPGPWRLLIKQISHLDPRVLNRLASQSYNRAARIAATRHGLASGQLSEATLKSLLLDDDEDVQGLLEAASAQNPEIATRYLELIRVRPTGKSIPTGLEGRLIASSSSLDLVRELEIVTPYSNAPWEALTYLAPVEMVPEARQVLMTDASQLRQSLL